MSLTTRLCVFAALAVAALIAWQWHMATDAAAHEETLLAVQQFDGDAGLPAKLQQAALVRHWWPLIWPALIVLLGLVMFWDDLERWWKQESQEKREDHV
jgi:hypothetical protein